ncbi:MAG: hypothetical protein IPG00_22545 [Saprospiraceae bacterium]|nr:hypothetical protein [Saprospiraceae bacterium]
MSYESLSANITKITKKNLRLGIDFGYEVLISRVDIKAVWQHETATSTEKLSQQQVNRI